MVSILPQIPQGCLLRILESPLYSYEKSHLSFIMPKTQFSGASGTASKLNELRSEMSPLNRKNSKGMFDRRVSSSYLLGSREASACSGANERISWLVSARISSCIWASSSSICSCSRSICSFSCLSLSFRRSSADSFATISALRVLTACRVRIRSLTAGCSS